MKSFLLILITLLSLIIFLALWFVADRFFIGDRITATIDSPKIKHEQAIQIEILNSTGVDGLASQMMDYLRKRGFDVVRVGNFQDSIISKSQVIERNGHQQTAVHVAFALNINDSCIVIRPDSSLFLNCTVIIGKDYKKLSPFK